MDQDGKHVEAGQNYGFCIEDCPKHVDLPKKEEIGKNSKINNTEIDLLPNSLNVFAILGYFGTLGSQGSKRKFLQFF